MIIKFGHVKFSQIKCYEASKLPKEKGEMTAFKRKWKEKHLRESRHGIEDCLRFPFLQKLLEIRQCLG